MASSPGVTPGGTRRYSAAAALTKIRGAGGKRFAAVFERGSIAVEIFAPIGVDLQTPHTRDELYVVVEGKGVFVSGNSREPFGPGDLLFAPAGLEHRFEGFTDIVVWVIFYGPEGGERVESGVK